MQDREPTVRSRELGDGLRHAMEGRGFHASGVARELGWSPSRVSRILSGKRGGSSHDVAAFIAVCGVRGDERERLMALSLDHAPGWYQRHHPAAPRRVRTLLHHENHARTITAYHGSLIPDLIQTGDYAAAVLDANPNTAHRAERIAALTRRQQVLEKVDAPSAVFFLHELALHTPVGGPSVMSDQLHSLLRRSVRPNLTIRVVPRQAGAHAAMTGPFALLDVRDFKPIVYIEEETASHILETPAETGAYRNVVASLARTALDENRSREVIATLATTLYGHLDTLPG